VSCDDDFERVTDYWINVTLSHTSLKFGMAAPYQSDEIWVVDSEENH